MNANDTLASTRPSRLFRKRTIRRNESRCVVVNAFLRIIRHRTEDFCEKRDVYKTTEDEEDQWRLEGNATHTVDE